MATTNRLSVGFGDDDLNRFANMLGAVSEEKGRQALARAVNRTTRTVQSRVIRAIAKRSGIPTKIVRRQVRVRLASHKGEGAIDGVVYANGKPLSLKHFKARQFSFGVRAKVYNKWERIPSAFIYAGNYRSGKLFSRGHVFLRTSKDRYPVELQTGPSVPEEMVVGEAVQQYETTVAEMLPRRVAHELGRMLNP